MISFVGAGPGAPDLLTLRAAERLAEADVVVWAASLVAPTVLSHCRADAERHDSSSMTLEQVTAVYASRPEARIVRLHSGDPSIYGAIAEQIEWCTKHDRAFEIVPGVTSMAAAAAAIGQELTVPGVTQSVVMTRLASRTRTSAPEHETVAGFATQGASMAIFLSAAQPDRLAAELVAVGSRYTAETPAVIAHRVSWPDERVVRTTVGGLANSLRELHVKTTVIVLVGPALAPAPNLSRSHVYAPEYSHAFREAVAPTPKGTAVSDG